MKMRKSLSISIYLFLLAGLLLVFANSCSKDDGPTSSDENGDAAITLLEQTIDASGGALEAGDIVVEIPPGAFNSASNLVLSEHIDGQIFGQDEASVFYSVSGIPVEFAQQIKVFIQPVSSQKDDLFMALGEESFRTSTGDLSLSYRFLEPVKEANGLYSISLEPITGNIQGAEGEVMKLSFGLVNNFEVIEGDLKGGGSSSNFRVFARRGELNALLVKDYMEEAYDIIVNDLNFNMEARTRKIDVYYQTFNSRDAEMYGYFSPSKWGDNWGSIYINEELVTTDDAIKSTSIHELFHLTQALYDPRNFYLKAVMSSPWYWVDEATATWIEELMVPENTPSVRSGNVHAPLVGFDQYSEMGAANYGYGMSAFIKFIVDEYGSEKILQIYNERKAGGYDNILGVFMGIIHPDPFTDAYRSFLQKYYNGEIYDDISDIGVLPSSQYVFSSLSSSEKSFEYSYPALSAKIYRFGVNEEGSTQLSNEHSLEIKSILEGNSPTIRMIFDLEMGQLPAFRLLAHGSEKIPNIKNLYPGKRIDIMMINLSMFDEVDDELLLKVIHQEQELEWMDSNLDVDVGNNWWPEKQYRDSDGEWYWHQHTEYGRLYDWETAMVACPDGWRLPTNVEWQQLVNDWGGNAVAGGKLKSTLTGNVDNNPEAHPLWDEPNEGATNESGFSALPGGNRGTDGYVQAVGRIGYWWSATSINSIFAWGWLMSYDMSLTGGANLDKEFGYSVRCVRGR